MKTSPMIKTALRGLVPAVFFGAASLGSLADDIPVKILFDENSCPQDVDIQEVELTRANNDRVEWSAYSLDGSTRIETSYSVYFDPFRGQPLNSNPQGDLKSPPIDPGIPDGVYKYAVLGTKCPEAPLDPNIRVR